MQMEGRDRVEAMHMELIRIKRGVNRAHCAVAALIVLVLILFIALIAVAVKQDKSIDDLKSRQHDLLPNPNITFATRPRDRQVQGLTYGGSLFRGSGFWAAKKPLPGTLTDHAAIGYNEVVFILGGADENGTVTSRVWKYDPVFHNYTEMAPMPEPRYRFGAAIIDSTIYVVGGRNVSDSTPPEPANNGLVNTTFIYDIGSNTWKRGANAPGPQGDTCAAALDGKVYMIGGYGEGYVYLNTTTVYDPRSDTWSSLPAAMPTARGDLMCVALNGEIYVLGGYYDGGAKANSFSDKMESYNPQTKTWTTRPPLLTPRGDAGIAVLEGQRIMLIGGEGHYRNDDSYKYPKHVNEVYYATEETWVQKAMIPTARFRTAAATAGGLTFVLGGADVCIDVDVCPALDQNEVFLDVDHPHVYLYLKNEAYNDTAALTTYPL